MTSIEKFSNISKKEIKQISKKDDEMVSQKTRNLEESEFKYRTIFNASPDIIYVTDYYGNVLDANQAWMDIIGVKREDFDKINITDFYIGNNTEELGKYIQEIRNGKEIKGIEVKAKNIVGELFDFEINSLPVEKDGRIFMVINIARDITKRKETERKLRDSEENYRLISESANDLIRVMNDKFEFDYINEKVHKRLLGYSKEDMLGKMSLEFIHPQDRRSVIRSTRNYLRGEKRSYEARFRSKSGDYKWFEMKAKVFYDDRGDMNILSIARDINDRKLAELKLMESEEKYRLISENANDLIRVLNEKFEFEYINEKVHKKLLGYSKTEMLGKRSLEFVHPQDRRSAIRSTRRSLDRDWETYETRYRCKNGEYRWFENKIELLYHKQGVMKVLSIARDINDRKLAELKLKESEEKYRLISENANDLISILNHKFKYEYINENAFIQILGHSKDDLIGKSALKFIHPDDLSLGTKSLLEGFKNGKGVAELRYRHKNGNLIWIETKGQTFTNANGDLKAILVSRDVTERKLNEQKTQESERRFRQLYKQLSFYKDLFAHDISNILHVIRSSTELLSLQLSEQKSKEIEELVNIIDKQIERGTKLMSSAFTLSELEESEISIKTLKLCDVLSDSIEYFKKTHEEKNIKIEVQCKKANKEILVKASYLLQDIFDNILNNAIIYNTNPQVEILISLSSERIEDVNYLKIEFKDNGIGISDDKKKLVFERGNRELKGSKGMGLGLSIVKKILDSYQGKIWVEDRVKGNFTKGTNFVLILREIE